MVGAVAVATRLRRVLPDVDRFTDRVDAPEAALDEYDIQQRNSARSIGLTVTQNLMLIPIGYLIFGSVITKGADTDMAYAGGLMALTVLLIGGCSPAMILGWTKRSDAEDGAA
jgi:hypothetical protein